MPPKKLLISGPGQGVAAASPVEPLLPDPSDALGEFQETTEIRRTAVVLVMPPEFAIERFLLHVHRSIEDSSEVPQVWRLRSEGVAETIVSLTNLTADAASITVSESSIAVDDPETIVNETELIAFA